MKGPILKFKHKYPGKTPASNGSSRWLTGSAVSFSLVACLLYGGLFFLVPVYYRGTQGQMDQMPIFIRIMLNVYPPFLVVLILISVALLILFQLKLKQISRSAGTCRPIMAVIVFNFLFAALLFGITLVGIR